MTRPRIPPRFVPTLTTVIDVAADADADVVLHEPVPDGPETAAGPPAPRIDERDTVIEEDLMDRVLERVGRSLEDEVSDVVAAEVQAQLDVMVPRLRREIEKVVRRLVIDALARERAAGRPSDPGSTLV